MRAVLVEDERLARSELKRLLRAHPEVEIVGEATEVESALELIRSTQPDLIFLDIQMPGKNGLDLLQELDPVPEVIFTTAFDQHAIQAFEFNALDYLLKPLEPYRLAQALEKAGARLERSTQVRSRLSLNDRFFVKDGKRCWFVHIRDVSLLTSEGNYTRIHFASNRPLVHRSLSYLEQRLDPEHFFRLALSNMIGLKWVASLKQGPDGSLLVILEGGIKVAMSRRRAQLFRNQMGL